MKKESKNLKRKDGLDIDFTNCKKVMSSNLPLLFANGQPRSLETISQPELEEFVPFMVRCSLGQEILKTPKEINNCPAPEWWPQGFPFKFPLAEQSDWINRHVMLKSLVCRCYTFYDCEFLLKFSSELAEMSPSQLRFDENKDENTTSIFDTNGCMLVKCRNENLNYDMHKNHRRYLSPAHTAPPASRKSAKRKTSIEQNEEPAAKQRCVRRMFDDFPKELPEPTVYSQEKYMEKFQLIPLGKEIGRETLKVEKRKRLASSFNILSISSRRGQELLMKNKHSFNLGMCLERIDRFCTPGGQEDPECNQVCTRAAAVFSAMYKQDEEDKPEMEETNAEESSEEKKWCHAYKWPHRTKSTIYPYMGPSVKPCTVQLKKLSEEDIRLFSPKKMITISTMTPVEWWSTEMAICKCQLVPVFGSELPKLNGIKYKHKKSSTRCTCGRSKSQYLPSPEGKNSLSEVKAEANKEVKCEASTQESSVKSRSRASSDNTLHRSGEFSSSGGESYKKTVFRRPLAVVSSTPAAVSCPVISEPAAHHHLTTTSQHIAPTSANKVNFSRSILDAIKWYTKDDSVLILPDELSEFSIKEEVKTIDPSQENIKPLSELSLPNLVKPIDYFQQNLNVAEYDYCFKRTTESSSKLVTRRGERHYINREPCPSCFQGRDNFCVYEFVRQAKLAGLSLQENQKQLRSWFFKFITAVNKKS